MDLLGLNLLIFFINYKVSDMYTLVDSTFKLYVTSHVIFYQMARLNHWERLSKRGRVPEGDRLICFFIYVSTVFLHFFKSSGKKTQGFVPQVWKQVVNLSCYCL